MPYAIYHISPTNSTHNHILIYSYIISHTSYLTSQFYIIADGFEAASASAMEALSNMTKVGVFLVFM
jgi:hypothetical protein